MPNPSPVPVPAREILERYVPAPLAAKLFTPGASLAPREVAAAIGPVLDLYRAIARYCPRPILEDDPLASPSPAVRGSFLDGTTLYADVSGFTTLTSRLCRLGRAGAEEVTDIVNQVFTRIEHCIAAYGGYVAKFGGDSVLAFFETAPGEAGGDALRAAAASFDLLREMEAFRSLPTSQGPVRLEISAGLASGPVFAVRVGLQGERRDFLLTGLGPVEAPVAEAAAPSMRLCLTRSARDRAGAGLEASACDHGFFLGEKLLRDVPLSPPPSPLTQVIRLQDPVHRLFWLIHQAEALRPFLPHPLYEKVCACPGRVAIEGEHRTVTSLFAACEGLGAAVSRFGPESAERAAQLANDYFLLLHRTVLPYQGLLARVDLWTGGDKVLLLFGAPLAHENDEERAILCALDLARGARELGARYGLPLSHRTGVNTGLAFCGDVGSFRRKEYTVMGEDVNLAARLMSSALPGQVFLGPCPRRLTLESVPALPLPPMPLKGRTEPVRAFLIQGEKFSQTLVLRRAPTRPDGGRAIPLIGRARELDEARALLDGVLGGKGRTLLLGGPAGIGKTLFAEHLLAFAQEVGFRCTRTRCLSHGAQVPFLPWVALLKGILGLRSGEDAQHRRRRLRDRVAAADPDLLAEVPLLARLLGLPPEEEDSATAAAGSVPEAASSPEHAPASHAATGRLFEVVSRVLVREAQKAPTALFLDDVQWMDPSSAELTAAVANACATAPLLVLLAGRPGHPLERALAREAASRIPLRELSDDETLALGATLLGMDLFPPRRRGLLLERSQGNPLFVRETVRALAAEEKAGQEPASVPQPAPLPLEGADRVSGFLAGALPRAAGERAAERPRELDPTGIAGMLLSRLDALDEAQRNCLKLASALGPEFDDELLARLLLPGRERDRLPETLVELGRHGLLEPLGGATRPAHRFTQVLLQEAAYETLPHGRRAELHGRIAEALEERHRGREAGIAALLAHHYERTARFPRTVRYLRLAASAAREGFALPMAAGFLERAVVLLREMPAVDAGGPAVLPETLVELGDVLGALGDEERAATCYQEALLVARARNTADLESRVERSLGESLLRRGDTPAALAHLREALERARADHRRTEEAACLHDLAVLYEVLGHGAAARKCLDESLSVRRELKDRRGEADCLHHLGRIEAAAGRAGRAAELFADALRTYEREGARLRRAGVLLSMGEAELAAGRPQTARERFAEAAHDVELSGEREGQARAAARSAEADAALGRLAAAIAAARATAERAAVHRERGAEVVARNVLGAALLRAGDLACAAEALDAAATLLRTAPALQEEVKNLVLSARRARRAGSPREGLRLAQEAARKARTAGLEHARSAALGEAGEAHRVLGDRGEAHRVGSEARELARELADRRGEAAGALRHARLLRDGGDLESAVDELFEALRLWKEAGDPVGQGWTLTELGAAHREMSEGEAATGYLREATTAMEGAGCRRGLAAAHVESAALLLEAGDLAGVERSAALAESLLQQGDEPGLRAARLRTRARLERRRGRTTAAALTLNEALALARDVGDAHGMAEVLLETAAVCRSRGEAQTGLSLGEDALARVREFGASARVAAAAVLVAELAADLGDHDRAGTLLEEAERLARETAEERLLPAVLAARSGWLLERGDLASAEAAATRACRRAGGPASGGARGGGGGARSTDVGNRVLPLLALGSARRRKGALERALSAFADAAGRAEASGDRERLAACFRESGDTARLRADYERAGRDLRRAESLAEEGELTRELVLVRLALCDFHRDLGQWDAARTALELARDVAQAAGLESLRPGLLRRQGELELSAAAVGEGSLWAPAADAAHPVATAAAEQEAAARAAGYLERAEAAARERAMPWERVLALAAQAMAARLAGRPEELEDLVFTAQRLLETIGAPDGLPGLPWARAESLATRGRLVDARACLDDVEARASASGRRGLVFQARVGKALLHRVRDLAEESARETKRALELFGELADRVSDRDVLAALRRTPAAAALFFLLRQAGGE